MILLKKLKIKNFISVGNVPIEIDLCNHNKTIVVGSNGTGKEAPISEPVLTPLGWSTMGAIRPGDYVIGSAGTPIKVLSIHPQGVKDVYTVKTMDGVDIRCGKDHLWSVWVKRHGKNVLITKTTQELIDNGVRKSSDNTARYTLPKFDGLQEGISVSFGYALGYCLGNGCFSQGQLKVSYDDRIESKLLPLLESSLGIPTNSRNNGGHSAQSGYSWSAIHPEIAKYRDSGLSHDKNLHKDHSDWLLWDYQSRLELLQGLLDSNGCVGLSKADGRPRSSFSSTSINLIVLVRDLVRSLGGRACEPIADNRTHYKSGNCWNLSFRLPVCPFKLHDDRWRPSRRSMQSTISEIVQNGYQEEQVCITVDAEDQLYVTTGFKLTHNSSTLLDSIVYALYGVAYRNINKSQLINSTNKAQLLVELEFSSSNNEYKIVRGQQPNVFDIYINGEKLNELSSVKEQQKYLEDHIIKINYLTFSNIAILGSCNYIPFMEQPVLVRRTLIEELLDIKIFAEMLVVAKERNKELYDEIKSISNDIKSNNEQVVLIQSFINTITNTTVVDNSEEINRLNLEKDSINKNINLLMLEKDKLELELSGFSDPQPHITKLKTYVSDCNAAIKLDNKQIKFYESNNTCPTCTQSIDPTLKRDSILKFKSDIQSFETKLDIATKKLNSGQAILSDIQKLTSRKTEHAQKMKNLNSELTSIDNRISRLSIVIPKSNNSDITEYNDKLTNTKANLESLYNKLDLLKVDKNNYDIVVKLLSDSGIKSKILEKYLPYFNSYINNYLNIFGLNINFTFNSLFKEIICARDKQNFSYESFSEGEKMKISLAIMLSFRDLASLNSANSTNILIMDEVFDSSLDYDSNNNLMSIINQMVDHNIMIITHREDVAIDDFDRVMQFSKVDGFTKIAYPTN
jgi:DNA repair exonuclease SbcCD ATPase subunit